MTFVDDVAGASAIPVATNSQMGPEYGKWFQSGGNVPARQSNGQNVRAPGSSRPETLFFKS